MNPRIRTSARTTLLLLATAVLLSSCTALHSSITPPHGAALMHGGMPAQDIVASMHGGAATAPGLARGGESAWTADGQTAEPGGGLLLHMHDASTVRFAAEKWELTVQGVRGEAEILGHDGTLRTADTTISYWDVSSAAAGPGRGTLLSQFLLTILGVILVIGLAAIILYAAFLATKR